MSINTLVTTNTSNNPRRLTPEPFVPAGTGTVTAYVRPADWPALDTIGPTDQKFSGLLAVYNTSMEYVALTITGTGTLTVDWGDGSSETLTTNVAKQHQYNYSTLGTSVTSRGYKTALVNVTTTGTITAINLQVKPTPASPNNALSNGWGPRWLDVALGSPNLTGLTIGNSAGTTVPTLMEQISIISVASTYNPGTSQFGFCTSLQSIPTYALNTITINRDMNSMFYNCFSLVTAPDIDLSRNTNCFQMFYQCVKLEVVPQYTLTNNTNTRLMFVNCQSLRTIPAMNYSLVTSAQRMFDGCSNLEYVPDMNFSESLTATNSMFSACISLRIAPYINTINVSDTSSMFQGCFSLTKIPLYNVANAVTTTNMFYQCRSLKSLPGPWNFAKSTSFNLMFGDCFNLVTAPILSNTSLVTNVGSMFANNYSLASVPLFDTSNVTTFASTFDSCFSLGTVPLFNMAKTTTLSRTFANTSITSIPTFNTVNVTIMSNAFNTCKTIKTIPSLDTSNVTNTNGMFSGATGLINLPALNLVKVTDIGQMFSGCNNLANVNGLSNTSNVTTLNATFFGCSSITELPPNSTFDTSKVTNMSQAFQGCTSLISLPTYNTINVTNNTNFLTSANAIANIPALNFSNVVTSGTLYSGNNITQINTTGMKVTHSIAACSLGSTELTNYMNNGIVGNTTAQTLTIVSNPGATTALVKTSGITANSSVITMANTVGVVVGSYMYGTGITTGINVSFIGGSPDSTFTYLGLANHGLQNGDSVMFTSFNTNPGITLNQQYYVVNRTSSTFQVAMTPGGTRVILSVTSQGIMSIGGATIANKVTTVTSNVSIAINGIAQVSNASASLTNRALNQNYATTKNWTVTG